MDKLSIERVKEKKGKRRGNRKRHKKQKKHKRLEVAPRSGAKNSDEFKDYLHFGDQDVEKGNNVVGKNEDNAVLQEGT